MKKQLKHIVVNINDLKPAAYNPREELRPGDPEYENIKNSIQEFGYADAIVVNKDLTVIKTWLPPHVTIGGRYRGIQGRRYISWQRRRKRQGGPAARPRKPLKRTSSRMI